MIKIFVKFDFKAVCSKILEEKLTELGLAYKTVGFGEIEFLEKLNDEKRKEFNKMLAHYNIELVEDHKSILVQKIKDTIIEMVYNTDQEISMTSSAYLSEKLEHSYGYLANLFSEVTYTSIENFIILQKIEYTKYLILNKDMSLTEIAFKLNYSSVAHLSTQFKNTTGITPSAFQRIIAKRKEQNK